MSFSEWAFMARCKPQKCDARAIATKHQIVFVGHPPWIVPEDERDPHALHACMLDISQLPEDWDRDQLSSDVSKRKVAEHRNRAHEFEEGSMVAIPRAKEGVVYLAPIEKRLELISDPPWLDEYLSLRREQGVEAERVWSHAADVAQVWRTGEFREVPFPRVPGWITRSLFGRSQLARFNHSRPDGKAEPVDVLKALYEGDYKFRLTSATGERDEVRNRLQRWLTPTSFEQFACNALQAIHPDVHWWHVGGSGDGGADGVALDRGRVVGALQCKFKAGSDKAARIGRDLREDVERVWGEEPEVYVATLFTDASDPQPAEGVHHLGANRLAEIVLEHRTQLPTARRIGVEGA